MPSETVNCWDVPDWDQSNCCPTCHWDNLFNDDVRCSVEWNGKELQVCGPCAVWMLEQGLITAEQYRELVPRPTYCAPDRFVFSQGRLVPREQLEIDERTRMAYWKG